jgi:NAD(P)-dependent dehydrogenase (short-subunit alcohol dehydrogenase family)
MEIRLDAKTAIVTGGSRGIGLAIARGFAEAGANVMITARKEPDLAEAAESLKGLDGSVAFMTAHAGDPEQAEACILATIERFGGLDILVNNAASNPYFGPLVDLDAARAQKTVEVNQIGILTWSQLAYKKAMAEHGGNIINLASIGGLGVEPGIGWYNVTKAAVIHITRQLSYELAPHVRVNALAPGLVKTYFARALWEDREEKVASHIPLRRLGEPEDIANAAVFLASEAASWITGQTLVIDGGTINQPTGGVS